MACRRRCWKSLVNFLLFQHKRLSETLNDEMFLFRSSNNYPIENLEDPNPEEVFNTNIAPQIPSDIIRVPATTPPPPSLQRKPILVAQVLTWKYININLISNNFRFFPQIGCSDLTKRKQWWPTYSDYNIEDNSHNDNHTNNDDIIYNFYHQWDVWRTPR